MRDFSGNIRSKKKPGFHPLFRKYIFRKTAAGRRGGGHIDPQSCFRARLPSNFGKNS